MQRRARIAALVAASALALVVPGAYIAEGSVSTTEPDSSEAEATPRGKRKDTEPKGGNGATQGKGKWKTTTTTAPTSPSSTTTAPITTTTAPITTTAPTTTAPTTTAPTTTTTTITTTAPTTPTTSAPTTTTTPAPTITTTTAPESTTTTAPTTTTTTLAPTTTTAPPPGPVEWVSPEGVTIIIDSAGGWTVEQIHQMLLENALDLDQIGPTLTIKVQDVDLSSTATSASSVGGVYTSFSAIMYLKGVNSSFADKPDAILAHEFGHAWGLYHLYLTQQNDWSAWLDDRGLTGDPRLDTTYPWSKTEMIAEDYRLLFSSPMALQQWPGQMNDEIPDARDVPGLADFLENVWGG